LGHGGHDPAPSRRPVIVAGQRQLVISNRAFLKRSLAIALEHELRRLPNLDLQHQARGYDLLASRRLAGRI
jgi:hypothetical protein